MYIYILDIHNKFRSLFFKNILFDNAINTKLKIYVFEKQTSEFIVYV